MYFGLMLIGLIVGFILRKAMPRKMINPGFVALATLGIPTIVLAVIAYQAAYDPGLAATTIVARAGIPAAIACMIGYFVYDADR
ncbi:MAG: hypothetical protein ACJAYU_000874 [Bradymonadia bacterium]|jgi:hypothetical protein